MSETGIENDERKNGRGKKEKNVDDNLRLSKDIAMHQDYPNKKKRFKKIGNQNKEACPKCEQCGKSFKSLISLRSHSVVHSGLRPYECAVCNKSFTQSSSLRVSGSLNAIICFLEAIKWQEIVEIGFKL